MPTPINNSDVVGFVETTGEALAEANKLAEAVANEATKIASALPVVTSEMQREGVIRKEEAKQASDLLGTHEGALSVVRNLTRMIGKSRRDLAKQATASQGSATDTTRDDSGADANGCYVGSRIGLGQRDNAKLASDRALGLDSD